MSHATHKAKGSQSFRTHGHFVLRQWFITKFRNFEPSLCLFVNSCRVFPTASFFCQTKMSFFFFSFAMFWLTWNYWCTLWPGKQRKLEFVRCFTPIMFHKMFVSILMYILPFLWVSIVENVWWAMRGTWVSDDTLRALLQRHKNSFGWRGPPELIWYTA